MNDQTTKYRENELLAVCPLPVDFEEDTFKIQIKGADGRSTKWLSINGAEFNAIERVLLNGLGT